MTQELPEQMFRWIVESMPEAVVYSDREGIIRLWNRGAEFSVVLAGPEMPNFRRFIANFGGVTRVRVYQEK